VEARRAAGGVSLLGDVQEMCGSVGTFFATVGGQYQQALDMFEFTLLCTVALEGHDSLDVAASYTGRGNVHELQGKYEEALEMHSKSLDIKTRILGGDSHLEVAKSYTSIGVVYYRLGHEQALENFQKCLDITVRLVAPSTFRKA